jgi:hypothetical protein
MRNFNHVCRLHISLCTETRKDRMCQRTFHLRLVTYDSARNMLTPPKIANAYIYYTYILYPLSLCLYYYLTYYSLFNSYLYI